MSSEHERSPATLLPQASDELRALAGRYLAGDRVAPSLRPPDLVH